MLKVFAAEGVWLRDNRGGIGVSGNYDPRIKLNKLIPHPKKKP